jgi:hypothetical protein
LTHNATLLEDVQEIVFAWVLDTSVLVSGLVV